MPQANERGFSPYHIRASIRALTLAYKRYHTQSIRKPFIPLVIYSVQSTIRVMNKYLQYSYATVAIRKIISIISGGVRKYERM